MGAYIEEGCIGCGVCADICPEVFQMNDDNLSEVIGQVNPSNEDAAKDAAASCPVDVIRID